MSSTASTLHVVRGASAGGTWEMVAGEPDGALRGAVRQRYGFAETGTAHPPRNEVASAAVVLLVSWGAPYRIADSRDHGRMTDHPLGFVAGLSEAHAISQATGDARCIQVMLTPLGAHRLLGGLPMGELSNRAIGLDALFGAEAERLAARLHDADSWDARFGIVDGFVADRLDRAGTPPAGVAHAWRRLCESEGRMEIAGLAREMGCSRKYLATRFRPSTWGCRPAPWPACFALSAPCACWAARGRTCAGATWRWDAATTTRRTSSATSASSPLRPGAFLRARLEGRPGLGLIRIRPVTSVQSRPPRPSHLSGIGFDIHPRRSTKMSERVRNPHPPSIPFSATPMRAPPSTGCATRSAWSAIPCSTRRTAPWRMPSCGWAAAC